MKAKNIIQRKVIYFAYNRCQQKIIGWPKGTKFVKETAIEGDDVGTVHYWTIMPAAQFKSSQWIGKHISHSTHTDLIEVRFLDIFEVPELDENLISAEEMTSQFNIAGMTFVQRTIIGDSISITGALKITSIERFNKCFISFIKFPAPGDNWHKDNIIISHERTGITCLPSSYHNSEWYRVPEQMAENVWSNFIEYAMGIISGHNPTCPYKLRVEYDDPTPHNIQDFNNFNNQFGITL